MRAQRLAGAGGVGHGGTWFTTAHAGGPWVQAAAASVPTSAPLVAVLEGEGTLSRGVADAIFRLHDRKMARRRKGINALKITGAFFGLNILDFALSNI